LLLDFVATKTLRIILPQTGTNLPAAYFLFVSKVCLTSFFYLSRRHIFRPCKGTNWAKLLSTAFVASYYV